MPEHVDREQSLPSGPTQKSVNACVGVERLNALSVYLLDYRVKRKGQLSAVRIERSAFCVHLARSSDKSPISPVQTGKYLFQLPYSTNPPDPDNLRVRSHKWATSAKW